MLPIILKAYPALVVSIVALDLLWLGIIMKDFYRVNLGHLMGDGVVWGAAVVFYLIFAAGLLYFAVMPGVAEGSLIKTMLLGALLGALCYATYDLTNQATLRDWPGVVTVIDIVWGAALSAAASAMGYFAATLLQ